MSLKQENVKERIIDASINLFLAKGYVGATTKELAEKAGVAKGTLYWHFKSKDEILEKVLDRFSEEMYDVAFKKVEETDGGFLDKFKVLYRYITEFARDKKELLLVSNTVLGELAGTGSVAEEKIKRIQMRAQGFFKMLIEEGQREGVVKRGLDADIQAHIIIASFIGMHLQWCLHGDSFDAASYARAYRETILGGLGISI